MKKLLVPISCLFAALAVACSGDSESASSTSPTARPEVTSSPVATATAAATATPVPPTATPEPPTPEPTPEPPTPEPPPPGPPVVQPRPSNPGSGPAGAPPGPSGPVSTTITASGLSFVQRLITARTGASVTVTLVNNDVLVPHDISIAGVASAPSCVGGCTTSVTFIAPAPGNYTFVCTVHPDMAGTFRVSP